MTQFTIKDLLDKVKPYFGIAILFLISMIVIQTISRFGENKDHMALINSLNATMVTYRNTEGLQLAKIQVMETEKSKNFLNIKSKDALILLLQDEIKKNKSMVSKPGSSVTAIDVTTDFQVTVPTQIVKPEIKSEFPSYASKYGDLWIKFNILAKQDSTNFKLVIKNRYTVIVGYEKNTPYALVKNFNPYSVTSDMKTYAVSIPKPKRLSFGINIGYGISGATGLFPYVGLGLNYDLVNLR